MGSNEALLDASAFLELEKGLPDNNLDGVEAAIQAASAPMTAALPAASSSTTAASTRINKASLERIAAAAKNGHLSTFGNMREDTIASMDAIRAAQVSIFHEHMRFDVFDSQEDLNFSSKDFLTNFQTAHLAKEKNMAAITKSLEHLSTQLSELNARTGVPSAIPGDPLGQVGGEKPVAAPKMSLRNAANRIMENNKVKGARVMEAFSDAVTMQRIHHGGLGVDTFSSAGTLPLTSPSNALKPSSVLVTSPSNAAKLASPSNAAAFGGGTPSPHSASNNSATTTIGGGNFSSDAMPDI